MRMPTARTHFKPRNCVQCLNLNAEYARAELSHAVASIVAAANINRPTAEYDVLRGKAHDAFLKLEIARLELERHQRIHTEAN